MYGIILESKRVEIEGSLVSYVTGIMRHPKNQSINNKVKKWLKVRSVKGRNEYVRVRHMKQEWILWEATRRMHYKCSRVV